MNPESLERSAAGLLASILAGGQWLPGLEGLMGEMDVLGGGIARIVHPRMYAIPTGGVAETFGQVGSGKTPTLTARTSMRPKPEQGFLADHIEIPDEVRRQDAFYQEFLRPRQCIFKTSAFLDTNDGGAVDLLIYRTQRQGAFQPDEMKRLGSVLPYVRSAAMVTRGALGEAARRQAEPFERRGEPVLYLGADGRVRDMNPAAERARDRLFKAVDRRVVSMVITDQRRIDRALKGALDAGKPGLVTLHALSGSGRVMALVLPVAGQARDVFHAVSSLVVFLEHGTQAMPDERSLTMLREATGLTAREADAVRVVAGGATPQRAAEILGIGVGTVRLHLKAAFAKLGVHSQAELTTLVGRLG